MLWTVVLASSSLVNQPLICRSSLVRESIPRGEERSLVQIQPTATFFLIVKSGESMSEDIVKEHYQKHTVTEIEHIPDHDQRKETLTFRNAKKQLEKVEHLGCFVCGSMEKRESHHIFERCWANGFDYKKVAHVLYNFLDFHGHCKRDFKSEDELLQYFIDHFDGKVVEREVTIEDGEDESGNIKYATKKVQYVTCDDDALDTLYNQLILCKTHHRDEGHSAHGSSFATFVAWTGHQDNYVISMSPEEYSALQHK